mmetsp:Transcript_103938/g.320612  ORF Transcript_103938/g.320612 Transcript_103938/m.320612 type:complete len:212 (-) Transcript_103938:392-1027(-)
MNPHGAGAQPQEGAAMEEDLQLPEARGHRRRQCLGVAGAVVVEVQVQPLKALRDRARKLGEGLVPGKEAPSAQVGLERLQPGRKRRFDGLRKGRRAPSAALPAVAGDPGEPWGSQVDVDVSQHAKLPGHGSERREGGLAGQALQGQVLQKLRRESIQPAGHRPRRQQSRSSEYPATAVAQTPHELPARVPQRSRCRAGAARCNGALDGVAA